MLSFPVGIVLYNPPNSTINRINKFAQEGVQFYIFDNSDSMLAKHDLFGQNIKYFSFSKNLGLSYSIDFLCKEAILDDKEALLFFDQDTIFTLDTLMYIDRFINYKTTFQAPIFKDVISISFRDINLKEGQTNVIESFQVDEYLLYSIFFSINSGTLYHLDKFYDFKWFNEGFFVDGVDYSFCLNALINGYKNLAVTNVPGLNHSEEQDGFHINFFRKKGSFRVYPLKRNVDFLKSHFRLFFITFKVKGIKTKFFIVKAILSYVFTQVLSRIVSIFNRFSRKYLVS
jgi:rhamnosyltransferase